MQINLLQPVQWNMVGIVIAIFAALSILVALLILLVSKLCKTRTDETAERILQRLAGANCGGCGCNGCAAFADKLCSGSVSLNECHVTDTEDKKEIAALLGVPFTANKPTVSVCHCLGGDNAIDKYTYVGAHDCMMQSKLDGGKKACPYGCLGEGNCVHACPEDAIALPHVRADVNPNVCVSCGACLHVCPKNLFSRIPSDAKVYIGCSSHERGKAVLDVCSRGCIACGKCAKTCPSNAISMRDNLPVINYETCIRCGQCADVCPRKTIVKRY